MHYINKRYREFPSASCTMKGFLISFGVFTLIIRIESMVPVEQTMPEGKNYPPLILKKYIGLFGYEMKPAVPHEIRIKKINKKETRMLMFESVDKMVDLLSNLSLSYKCPAGENSPELVKIKKGQCSNQLTVSVFVSDNECGNVNRIEYDIGYGTEIPISKFYPDTENQPVKKKLEHWLYTSCFDRSENRAYAARYELWSRNMLYQISTKIYPEKQNNMILELHSKFMMEMAKKVSLEVEKDKSKSKIIPFQLVSHEDMILYNWKLATFNEKNYSFIWNNVADNSWKNINRNLRKFMARCNYDLEVFSGVHEYTIQGYPRYIWKYIRKGTSGMAVVIHNQPLNDEQDYPKLCTSDPNCDGYAFVWPNETDKNKGYSYCCTTRDLQEQHILFFEDKFSNFDKLELKELTSDDDEYHPSELDIFNETLNSSSRPSSPSVESPTSSSSSSKSSSPKSKPSSLPTSDGNRKKAVVTDPEHKESVPIHLPTPKFSQPAEGEVGDVRNAMASWIAAGKTPPNHK